MEGLGNLPIDVLAKEGLLGLAVLVMGYVIVILWRDNLRLRDKIEADQAAREKRDDGRFAEVKTIAEAGSAALAKAASAETALGAALAHTDEVIEKQGDLIEARTANFVTMNTSMALIDASVRALKETVDDLRRNR